MPATRYSIVVSIDAATGVVSAEGLSADGCRHLIAVTAAELPFSFRDEFERQRGAATAAAAAHAAAQADAAAARHAEIYRRTAFHWGTDFAARVIGGNVPRDCRQSKAAIAAARAAAQLAAIPSSIDI